ncbi:MAG: M48 family metallopeptidase [candidate division WOR-3 bacterium]
MSEIITFYDLQKKNIRKTIFLILFFILIAGLLGFLIDNIFLGFPEYIKFPFITSVAILISGAQSFISYRYGDKIVLNSIGARPANPEIFEEKRLINIVEEMKIAAGIPMPKVYIVETDIPNAFATGKDLHNSSIAVTRGLLRILNREEMQGVIGHEIAHIKNRDILTMTVAATLLGIIIILSDIALRNLRFKDKRRRVYARGNIIVLLIVLILAVIAPIIAKLVFLAISRSREYLADATSAELTRNPISLANALEKIYLNQKGIPIGNKAISPLFIVSPLKNKLENLENLWADLWSTHPPIEKRIFYLKRMAHRI